MKRNIFALLRTFALAAFVPALSFSLVACEPESGDDGGGTVPPGVTPEVSVPDGYVNYFIEDLSFSRSAGEAKVAFQINVDWSMETVGGSDWLSVEPASGAAGLHKVMVRVTENDVSEVRTATVHLLSGKSKVAEILVTQEFISEGAVDLGLSVMWASCNVGAESPEEYGGYYAWGETEEKNDYSSSTSITIGLSTSELRSKGIIDTGGNLTAAYDAATDNWGSSWRMPTRDEIKELWEKCSWEWTSVNGIRGYKVTGPSGNSIFLPAAGHRYGTEVYDGSNGLYWSGTLREDDSYVAYYLGFDSGFGSWGGWDYRDDGLTVRPVTDK